MMMKYIRNKIEKMVRAIMEEDDTQSYICDLVLANLDPIPDAEEIADELSVYDVAQEVDHSSIAHELDLDEIVSELDYDEIADKVVIDVGNIEVDYDELAAGVVDHLDLEEIARHADVDKTTFSHIHLLDTKIDALIEVVRGSAMNTLDLMTFNKALEGEDE